MTVSEGLAAGKLEHLSGYFVVWGIIQLAE
jgi:hypothetical protein